MLRNNQISLIVLLIIIGVTLYLISCDKNDSPIKNMGELKIDESLTTTSFPKDNKLQVDSELLDEMMKGESKKRTQEYQGEEEYDEEMDEEQEDEEEEEQEEYQEEEIRRKKGKKTGSLDKYFDNCAVNGGSLYNKNDFIPMEESDNGAAPLPAAFKPPISKDDCPDCVYPNKNNQKKWASKDFLPTEKKDWFETDFANVNAEYNVDDNKLINTEKFIGINTVGQSLKNPSYDIRGTVACPKMTVSPWNNSTIEPDYNIRGL